MRTDRRTELRTVIIGNFYYCANPPKNTHLSQNLQRDLSKFLSTFYSIILCDKVVKNGEIFALLRCYTAQICIQLLTFREHLPLPSSRTKRSSLTASALNIRLTGCPETSVTINLSCVTTQKIRGIIYTAAEAWNYALWKNCITPNNGVKFLVAVNKECTYTYVVVGNV